MTKAFAVMVTRELRLRAVLELYRCGAITEGAGARALRMSLHRFRTVLAAHVRARPTPAMRSPRTSPTT